MNLNYYEDSLEKVEAIRNFLMEEDDEELQHYADILNDAHYSLQMLKEEIKYFVSRLGEIAEEHYPDYSNSDFILELDDWYKEMYD